MRRRTIRRGLNILEVCVILFLCIVIAALIFPFLVQRGHAGNAARRAQCRNNIRYLGLAMHNYHDVHNRLPPSGVWDVADAATMAEWSDLGNIANNPAHQATMRYSWVVPILPFIEERDIHRSWDFNPTKDGGRGSYLSTTASKRAQGGNAELAERRIATLECMMDTTAISGRGNISYAVNGGFSYHWKLDYATTGHDGRGTPIDMTSEVSRRWSDNIRHSGLFFLETSKEFVDRPKPAEKSKEPTSLSLSEVADGLANTVMIAENVNVGPGAAWETATLKSNWACPHPWNTSFFVNGVIPLLSKANEGLNFRAANSRGLEAPPLVPFGRQGGVNSDPNGKNEGRFPYPSSPHHQCIQVLLCDGSVRTVSQNIDPEIWAAMVTPNGKKFVDPSTGKPIVEPSLDPKDDD